VEGLLVHSDPLLELIGRQNCASEVVAGAQYVGVVRAEGPGVRKQAMYSWGGGSVQQSLRLDAGMKISRIVTVSQHFSKVLQRHCIRQINQCSNIGFGFSPRLSQT
jgi:hypothetical protein